MQSQTFLTELWILSLFIKCSLLYTEHKIYIQVTSLVISLFYNVVFSALGCFRSRSFVEWHRSKPI